METLLSALAPAFAAAFQLWGSPVSWAELVGVALALWMVVCQWRVQLLAWPLAIASSLIYWLLFWQAKLYGEAALQWLFIACALWGWWQWRRGHGSAGQTLQVHRLSRLAALATAAALLILWPVLALLLMRYTDSPVPWLDAAATAGSVVAQLLLARKLIENWPLWVGVNVFSAGLFAYKALWFTAALYLLFAAMAVYGWQAWRRALSH